MSAKDWIEEADGRRRELDSRLAKGEMEQDPAREIDRMLGNAQICATLAIAEAVLELAKAITAND